MTFRRPMKKILFLLFGTAAVCLRTDASPVPATVIPDTLNIRSAPGRASRIIGKLHAGETVRILPPADGEWCRVAMPDSASVWIAASMVNAAGIPLPDAVFRSGPGAAYEKIGRASPEKIEIRETAKNGKWLRIKPQKGLSAYVSTAYLKIGKGEKEGMHAPREKAASKTAHALERIRESAAPATAEGIVKRLNPPGNEATHTLVVPVNAEDFIAAYLVAPGLNLKLWENRRVRVSGTGQWLRGRNRPLIAVERIIPAWQR